MLPEPFLEQINQAAFAWSMSLAQVSPAECRSRAKTLGRVTSELRQAQHENTVLRQALEDFPALVADHARLKALVGEPDPQLPEAA